MCVLMWQAVGRPEWGCLRTATTVVKGLSLSDLIELPCSLWPYHASDILSAWQRLYLSACNQPASIVGNVDRHACTVYLMQCQSQAGLAAAWKALFLMCLDSLAIYRAGSYQLSPGLYSLIPNVADEAARQLPDHALVHGVATQVLSAARCAVLWCIHCGLKPAGG